MKNHLKTSALALALAIGMAPPLLCHAEKWLTIETAGSEAINLRISDNPKIKFSQGCIVITTEDARHEIEVSLTPTMRITESAGADAASISNATTQVIYSPSSIEIVNASPGETLRLFTLGGVTAATSVADDSGTARIETSSLQPGVYILSSQSINLKISIK